jgi:hypothetical protein
MARASTSRFELAQTLLPLLSWPQTTEGRITDLESAHTLLPFESCPQTIEGANWNNVSFFGSSNNSHTSYLALLHKGGRDGAESESEGDEGGRDTHVD